MSTDDYRKASLFATGSFDLDFPIPDLIGATEILTEEHRFVIFISLSIFPTSYFMSSYRHSADCVIITGVILFRFKIHIIILLKFSINALMLQIQINNS